MITSYDIVCLIDVNGLLTTSNSTMYLIYNGVSFIIRKVEMNDE